MSQYLLSVVGMILFSAVVTTILPEGKTSTTVKAVARMACVLTLVSPILKVLQKNVSTSFENISDVFFGETVIQIDEPFIKYYSGQRITYAQTAVETELFDRYGVSCKVEFLYEFTSSGEISIKKICVQADATEEVKDKMCEYLSRNYCSEVLIE